MVKTPEFSGIDLGLNLRVERLMNALKEAGDPRYEELQDVMERAKSEAMNHFVEVSPDETDILKLVLQIGEPLLQSSEVANHAVVSYIETCYPRLYQGIQQDKTPLL